MKYKTEIKSFTIGDMKAIIKDLTDETVVLVSDNNLGETFDVDGIDIRHQLFSTKELSSDKLVLTIDLCN